MCIIDFKVVTIMIRLKELREERDWSMSDAAKFLGKPYTTYVNHEKEYREPNSEDLVAYAKAYGVTVDYLVGLTNEKSSAILDDRADSDIPISIKDKRLLDWFRSLPQEKQQAILISQDAPKDLF